MLFSSADAATIGKIEEDFIVASVLVAFNQNKSVSQFYIQAGGVYLFAEPVPFDGKVTNVGAFGYFSDENLDLVFGPSEGTNDSNVIPFLYALAYRHDQENDTYQLLNEEFLTHTVSPGHVEVDWPVRKGDRIGAFIPHNCTENEEFKVLKCPSQINLRANPSECSSALYYPVNSREGSSIPASQLQEVQVVLNFEVMILQTGI